MVASKSSAGAGTAGGFDGGRGRGGRSGFVTLAVVGLGLFMAFLDVSIVIVSLPAMMRDLGVGISEISWVLNAYNLVFATALVVGGRLADQFGRRLTYVSGVVGFVTLSAACALAPSAGWLVAFRAVQGLAGAALVPATLALVVAEFPKERLGAGLGAWGAIGAFAAALGPSLGGGITEWASWRWIFWVNLPVGVLAVALSAAFLAESRDSAAGRRVDVLGVLTLSTGLFMLTLALIEGHGWGWVSGGVLSLLAGGTLAVAAWVIVERRTSEPMVDLSIFRSRVFVAASAVLFFTSVAVMGGTFLVPQFLVSILGTSELRAGLAVTPTALAVMIIGTFAGRLSDRFGARIPVAMGVLLMAVGLLLLSGLENGDGAKEVVPPLVLLGTGLGLSLIPANSAAMAALPGEGLGVASGMLAAFRQVGIVFGVAILVDVLSTRLSVKTDIARQEMYDIAQRAALPELVKSEFAHRISGFALDGSGSADLADGPSAAVTDELERELRTRAEKTIEAQLTQLPPSQRSAAEPEVRTQAMEEVRRGEEEIRAELTRVSNEVRVVAEGKATDAFGETYPFAAAAAVLGLVPAALLPGRRARGDGGRQRGNRRGCGADGASGRQGASGAGS